MGNWIAQTWQRSITHRALLVAPPVVVMLAWGFFTYGTRTRLEYYTRAVDRGPIEQLVQATGTINAVTTVQVGSQVSGNIGEISVDFNSKVKKDQIIAQIDPSTIKARLLQAEADLENARANVKGLEAQIETQRADVLAAKASVERARSQMKEAELQLKRTSELTEQGIFSAAQKDTAQAGYDQAVAGMGVAEAQLQQSHARLKSGAAQLDQAKAQVSQRKAAAELVRVDLSHCTIRAPIDGTVIARNVDVGQTVAASLSAPTLFLIAQDLTKMLVYAKTDEADVGKIRVGATARFRVDSFPRMEFRGKVVQVRMNATTVQNVVTYDTIVEFENRGERLFPGMTAYVSIPIESVDDAVRIPNGALRFKPDLSEEELKAAYAKYNIPWEDQRRRPAAGAGPGGGQAGGAPAGAGRGGSGGGQQGGGQGGGPSSSRAFPQRENPRAGFGGGQAGNGPAGAGGAGFSREQWGVVWKELPNKDLMPVRVKLGVTDFTYTELKEGDVKEKDVLIIGQSSGRTNNQQTGPGQQQRPGQGPMGGPGGLPRRM